MEQRPLKQHALYCTNEIKPGNMIVALRVTGGYSHEVRIETTKRVLRYLERFVVQKAIIYILNTIIKYTILEYL